MIGCLPYAPWTGIQPTTFWCMGWCSDHWSYPTGTVQSSWRQSLFFKCNWMENSVWSRPPVSFWALLGFQCFVGFVLWCTDDLCVLYIACVCGLGFVREEFAMTFDTWHRRLYSRGTTAVGEEKIGLNSSEGQVDIYSQGTGLEGGVHGQKMTQRVH